MTEWNRNNNILRSRAGILYLQNFLISNKFSLKKIKNLTKKQDIVGIKGPIPQKGNYQTVTN